MKAFKVLFGCILILFSFKSSFNTLKHIDIPNQKQILSMYHAHISTSIINYNIWDLRSHNECTSSDGVSVSHQFSGVPPTHRLRREDGHKYHCTAGNLCLPDHNGRLPTRHFTHCTCTLDLIVYWLHLFSLSQYIFSHYPVSSSSHRCILSAPNCISRPKRCFSAPVTSPIPVVLL